MLWLWASFLVCTVITLMGYELVFTPNVLKGKYNSSLCNKLIRNVDDGGKPAAPAQRLVIFLVDAMGDDQASVNWLQNIIGDRNYSRGSALAARPQSRPSQVAMFSGLYEDLLLMLRQRTSMDNVFLHVDHTFYFGPEKSLGYFEGSSQWISHAYRCLDIQDDGTSNNDLCDDFIMDDIEEMLGNKSAGQSRYQQELAKRNIYLIRLTSVELASHGDRTNYNTNIARAFFKVNTIIKTTYQLFENYFNDSQTAYMITSDYGLTEWGTHGDSLYEEVITPLVLWGPGVATGNGVKKPLIRQIDVCPLISGIVGSPVPAESLGHFYGRYYLNTTSQSLANGYLCTAIQLAELCQASWELINKGFLIKYLIKNTLPTYLFNATITNLTALQQEGNFTGVINTAEMLTNTSRQCLQNIRNFYKLNLIILMVMSYGVWIFGTLCELTVNLGTTPNQTLDNQPNSKPCFDILITVLSCVCYIGITAFSIVSIALDHLPKYYILFLIGPSLAWLSTTMKVGKSLIKIVKTIQFNTLIYGIILIVMVEYTYWAKYYPYVNAGYFMPYACVLTSMNYNYVPRHVTSIWMLTSVILTVISLVPLLGLKESPMLLNISSVMWIVGACFFSYALNIKPRQCLVTAGFASIICAAAWIIDLTYLGTNAAMKIIAWMLLPLPLLSLFGSTVLADRLFQVTISMVGPYLLLSTRQEPLVLLIVTLNLYTLLRLEASSPQFEEQVFTRAITLHYYLPLIMTSTGHLPYLSSYDIYWTRLFSVSFNNFSIALLIFYKATIMITIIVCFFYATCLYIGFGAKQMITITLLAAALSSLRHSIGIIFSEDPIEALPTFIVGNISFMALIIPFTIAPLLLNVTKMKINN